MFSKLFGRKQKPPETPENAARRFADDLISAVDNLYTHSYVFTRTPRGLIIAEEGQSLEYTVTDELLFDHIVRFDDPEWEDDVHRGLSEKQFGAELAAYMHDTLTGWTEDYHLERRRKLGLD